MSPSENNAAAERPIFITGVYRSGTTLPVQILDSHSQLSVTYDTVQYLRFYLDQYGSPAEQYRTIVEEVADRVGSRYSLAVPRDRILRRIGSLSNIEHRDIYAAIMRETFCADQPDVRWGEKSVLEWTRIPLFLEMFPQGKTILMMRDPRDVLASYREFTIEPPHRYLDAVFACLHCMEWATRIGSALPEERYYLLRHEDLVTDPETAVARLCRFLEIEPEPEMLDTSRFTDRTGEEPWRPNTAFGDVSAGDGIMSQTAERWRSHLSSFETLFVESVIGDLLERFGYSMSNERVSAADLAELWERFRATPLLQERLQRWLATGEGVESYPSDPTDPKSWDTTQEVSAKASG